MLLELMIMVVGVVSGCLILVREGGIVGTKVSVTVEPKTTDLMTVAPGDKPIWEVAEVGADSDGGIFVFASAGPMFVERVTPVLAGRALPEPVAPDAAEFVGYTPPVPVFVVVVFV